MIFYIIVFFHRPISKEDFPNNDNHKIQKLSLSTKKILNIIINVSAITYFVFVVLTYSKHMPIKQKKL